MPAELTSPEPILSVRNLSVDFRLRGGKTLRALESVNLDVAERQVHGLVGESGSGKTVIALTVMRLLDPPGRVVGGEIFWEGRNLLNVAERDLGSFRGRGVAMVFQNAAASLNPALRVRRQLGWVLARQHGLRGEPLSTETRALLETVRLSEPDRVLDSYPHELSGGMAQRVALALALACRPRLLIADEPTSSVDVTVAAQLIELLRDLQLQMGLSILLISHDLGVVASLCDHVSVLWRGRIVESASALELYRAPQHQYTQALLRSVPIPDPTRRPVAAKLVGDLPTTAPDISNQR